MHIIRIRKGPVHGVAETVVLEDVPKAGDGEEKGHDPRHPSERHYRCQQSALAVSVAPAKISPQLSGDGGTNDPQDEEDHEPKQFGTES